MLIKSFKRYFLNPYTLIFILSFIFYRGRIGSDDLEVFNFVHIFSITNDDFLSFLSNINNNSYSHLLYDELQKPEVITLKHRLIWVIQTYLIYQIISIFYFLSDATRIFLSQYFSGYILTLYTFISLVLVYNFFYRIEKDNNTSLFLSLILFFGSGIISFFTGAYIESLILLLFILRISNFSKQLNFISDIIIILIKPYYLCIVFFYNLSEIKFFKKISSYNYLFLVIFTFFIIYYFISSMINLIIKPDFFMLNKFLANYDIKFLINNFFNFYFSYGMGIFFTSSVMLFLIIMGSINKPYKTFMKFIGLIILSLFLSMWEGFHGNAPGNRYFLPVLIIFLPEIYFGIKKILNLKFYKLKILIISLISCLTVLNFPTLEYRNTSLAAYAEGAINKKQVVKFVKVENKKMKMLYSPINSIYFNHIFFSNNVLINKIINSEHINIKNYSIDNKNIYPMTGLGRLVYISKNDLKRFGIINEIVKKNHKILFFLYLIIILIFYLSVFRIITNFIKEKL